MAKQAKTAFLQGPTVWKSPINGIKPATFRSESAALTTAPRDPTVQRRQCTGARYGKTSKRGSRRNEEIGLMHAHGENEKCRNWQGKYRNRRNYVRFHSTRMPRPSSWFSTVNSWDPLSLLIHSFSRSRRCTMSVGALSRTVTRQEWSRCVKWTATGVSSLLLMEERWMNGHHSKDWVTLRVDNTSYIVLPRELSLSSHSTTYFS